MHIIDMIGGVISLSGFRIGLGLDISTSCTGVSVVAMGPSSRAVMPVIICAAELSDEKTLWTKSDAFKSGFDDVISLLHSYGLSVSPNSVFVEEALMGFRPGASSADTIAKLQRFNGIVTYIVRQTLGQDPQPIMSQHARKLCGIKTVRPFEVPTSVTLKSGKTKVGKKKMGVKEQVFAALAGTDLTSIPWELKTTGEPRDWAKDATDAYVVAKAGLLSL